MTIKELQQRLKRQWSTFTPAEQRIASWMLDHLGAIPFESAASLSRKVGVSPMTVGRFLHALGYEGLAGLKDELRDTAPWLELYKSFSLPKGSDHLATRVKAEIRTLSLIAELARTPPWHAIACRLASATRVSVASFQLMRSVGRGFADLLQQVRPRVDFADGGDGSYTDMLIDSGPDECIVLIEVERYSRHFRLLAEQAKRRGIPLVIVTDSQCHWAPELTDEVLMLSLESGRAWHSLGSMTILLSMLLDSVIGELGEVYDRIEDVVELRQQLVGYTGPTPRRRRKR